MLSLGEGYPWKQRILIPHEQWRVHSNSFHTRIKAVLSDNIRYKFFYKPYLLYMYFLIFFLEKLQAFTVFRSIHNMPLFFTQTKRNFSGLSKRLRLALDKNNATSLDGAYHVIVVYWYIWKNKT